MVNRSFNQITYLYNLRCPGVICTRKGLGNPWLENSQKISFWSRNGQKWHLKTVKVGKIMTQNLNILVHLWTFRAENKMKVCLLRPKTIPKPSVTTLKKSRKRLFGPRKLLKLTHQNGQSGQNINLKSQFGVIYLPLEL